MLKRYQVLLTDWLADYIKIIAEKYDVSFSEVIRLILCLYLNEIIVEFHPEYKLKFRKKDVVTTLRGILSHEISDEALHRKISQAYFEARKAIDYRIAAQKKIKSKKT